MNTDLEIRHNVQCELDWDTRLDSRQIGVAVRHGVVTLTGCVSSYTERTAAEEAAQKVAGVRAIANDLQVHLSFDQALTDGQLAESAVEALRANGAVPAAAITLIVKDGWISLGGQVGFWYQKNAAEEAVNKLKGVVGVTNNIAICSSTTVTDVTTQIEDAFRRKARLDADAIRVTVNNGVVTLEGDVASLEERNTAKSAAWQAPGVSEVLDKLTVRSQMQ